MAGRLASLFRGRNTSTDEGGSFAANAEKARRQGDLHRAVALCREGLGKAPEQLSARVTLGRALMDLGEYEEAKAELEYVVRRAPDNLAAIRGLAELHDRSENAALLHVEHLGDWPPRESDIARAVEAPVVTAQAAVDEEPVEGTDAIPRAAVELLEQSAALEAIAEEDGWVDPAAEPEIALDADADVNLEAIASELAGPEGAEEADSRNTDAAPPLSLEAGVVAHAAADHVETDATLGALERLLEKARARCSQATAGSAA